MEDLINKVIGSIHKISKLNRYLIYMLIFITFLFPIVYFFNNPQYSGYFIASRTAELIESSQQSHFTSNFLITDNDFGFLFLIKFILIKITGFSEIMIRYFPLGLIFLNIIFFSISRKITKNIFLSLAIAGTISFSTTMGLNVITIGPQSWSTLLHFTIFLLILDVIILSSKNSYEIKNIYLLKILVFVSLISLNFYYYTPMMWTIMLSFTALFINFNLKFLKGKKEIYLGLPIFLFPLILFISTTNSIKFYVKDVFSRQIPSIIDLVKTIFFNHPKTSIPLSFEKYLYIADSNTIIFISNFIKFLIIFLLIIWFLFLLNKKIKEKRYHNLGIYLGFMGISIAFSDFFFNFIHGEIILEYTFFYLPIILFISIYKITDKRKIFTFIFSCFLLSGIVGYGTSFNIQEDDKSSDLVTYPGASFLINNSFDRPKILASLEMHGVLLINKAISNSNYYKRYHDLDTYNRLIKNKNHLLDTDYLIIDKIWDKSGLNPAGNTSWVSFKNLDNYQDSLDKNENLCKIYISNYNNIYTNL